MDLSEIHDSRLLDAAEAYDHERSRWNWRRNKAYSPVRCEVFRIGDDDEPAVMAWTTGEETAAHEANEMGALAAIKAALAVL
jgi:hypothetical protein